MGGSGAVDLVIASFRRSTSAGVLDRFYELFIASSAEVGAKFAATDLERQKQMLQESLHTLLAAGGTIPKQGFLREHLERIAKRHSRADLDIRPELYDQWLDCLLAAIREKDPACTDEIIAAWRETMTHGIELMRSRYDG